MTNDEKNAIILYIEFRMRQFIETFEKTVDKSISLEMYEKMFDILTDLEHTIEMNRLLNILEDPSNKQ